MRKKLLRSRSGFEKPESREEAIMQNILGASNVLEPSESNIEEILKSILYNTPYTKEAEFEIEKILLAIKNNGTYDGEGESRDLKILIAILNDLDYTEEAESRIEELFIEWLQQRSQIKVLEGVPPLTFTSRGLPLINYLIEGNAVQSGTPTPDNPVTPEGTGERTGNLFDITTLENGIYLAANGNKYGNVTNGVRSGVKIKALPNTAYTLSAQSSENVSLRIFEWSSGTFTKQTPKYNISGSVSLTVTTEADTTEIAFNIEGGNGQYASNIMLNTGSTALPYEPYGYEIGISSANATTNIYLGEVQTTRKIKKLVLTGTEPVYSTSASTSEQGTTLFVYTYSNLSMNDIVNGGAHMGQIDYPQFLSNSFIMKTERLSDWKKTNNGELSAQSSNSGNNNFIIFGSNQYSTAEDFKTYLQQRYASGNPVTIYYILATPTTSVVNEPLRKIGTYADTVSKAQAGVEIPTNNGTTVIDVDTTLKPSNVYIEYK